MAEDQSRGSTGRRQGDSRGRAARRRAGCGRATGPEGGAAGATASWVPRRRAGVRARVWLIGHSASGAVSASTEGRLLGATDAEVEAAAQSVGVALKHPIFERAAASPNCRREVAVTNLAADGVVIEGVVDLAFLEEDPFGDSVWTVVDYKTDLGAGAPPEYVAQVRLYATAIAEATGLPTEAVLLAV